MQNYTEIIKKSMVLNCSCNLEAHSRKCSFNQWVKVELGVFTCHHQQSGAVRLCPNKETVTVCSENRQTYEGEMEKGGCVWLVETVWEWRTPQCTTNCNAAFWPQPSRIIQTVVTASSVRLLFPYLVWTSSVRWSICPLRVRVVLDDGRLEGCFRKRIWVWSAVKKCSK